MLRNRNWGSVLMAPAFCLNDRSCNTSVRKPKEMQPTTMGEINPTYWECGIEVPTNAGGFIARPEVVGAGADPTFVVFCKACGERFNAHARETGQAEFAPIAELMQRPQ